MSCDGTLVDLAEFYDEIARECPGAPDPTLDNTIRHAARELCMRTQIWREDLDPMTTVKNRATYELESPTDQARIVALITARHHDNRLTPKSAVELNALCPTWRDAVSDTAQHFVSDTPTTLTLYPAPSKTEVRAITELRAALQPTYAATQLPGILLEDHIEAIAHGALARLLRIPKQDWTDYALAGEYAALFRQDIVDAEIRALKGYQNTEVVVEARRLPGAP